MLSSIEQYNRKLRKKKYVVSMFAICPICKTDKLKDKNPCSKTNCPYNVEERGRPKMADKEA